MPKIKRITEVKFHGEIVDLKLVASTDRIQIFAATDGRGFFVITDENDVIQKIVTSLEKMIIHSVD